MNHGICRHPGKAGIQTRKKESAKKDMQKMLDYVDKLNELDTSKVEPMTHIFEMGNVFREDEVTNGDDRDNAYRMHRKSKNGASTRFLWKTVE